MAKAVSPPTKKKLNPWRKAVKQAMKLAAQTEVKRKRNQPADAFNYRWEHVQAVVQVAKKLAKKTGADSEVVEAAAWLHDVAKLKGEKHPEAGAKKAKEILQQTNFPPKKIERVAKAIAEHKGLFLTKPLKNLESQVLWDADKLTKIGQTGLIQISTMLIQQSKISSTEAMIKEWREANWPAKTVASMHTKPAKKAAKKRLAAMHALVDSLEAEIQGQDI